MIRIPVKFKGNAFSRNIAHFVDRELLKTMAESVLMLETAIALETPVNTGTLRSSIQGKVFSSVLGKVGVEGPASKYGIVMEEGRRPGRFPPPEPIRLWVRRKIRPPREEVNSIAFLVARKIAREGIRGRHMFEKGERRMAPIIIARFQQKMEQIERNLSR